jgi:hypothetical protein
VVALFKGGDGASEGIGTAEISTGRPTAGVSLQQQGSAWLARVGCTRRGARRSGRAAFVSMMKTTDLVVSRNPIDAQPSPFGRGLASWLRCQVADDHRPW